MQDTYAPDLDNQQNQLCVDRVYSLDDLPGAIEDRFEERERKKERKKERIRFYVF